MIRVSSIFLTFAALSLSACSESEEKSALKSQPETKVEQQATSAAEKVVSVPKPSEEAKEIEDGADKPAPKPQTAVRQVKAIVVKPTTTRLQRTYPVTVLPSQQIDLSFRVSGRITELPIKAGKRVKKHDVIAKLDERDFNSSVTQLESQIEQAKEQLKALESGARSEDVAALEASLAVEQALVEEAKAQFQRTEYLFNKKIVAKAKLDQDATALKVAEAKLEARRQELLKGQAGGREEEVKAQQAAIRGLESQLQSQKDTLADATLRAPIDGMIAKRTVENFTNIQAKETVAVLQTLNSLKLQFNVPAPDVPILAREIQSGGIERMVVLDALPNKRFVAEAEEFSTDADAATQTYQGTVSIPDTGGEAILPGMAGKLIVTANNSQDAVISVPISAISSEPGGTTFVWVVDLASNTVKKRPITSGKTSGGSVAILDGLADGEVIVTAGTSALQEGMQVKTSLAGQ